MPETLDDTTIHAAAAGDRSAMDRLLRVVSPRMHRQLGSYGLDPEERADAHQNALLKIARGLSSFREESQLWTWIFRVTANEAFMLLRQRKRSRARLVGGLQLDELGRLPAMQDTSDAVATFCAARGAARLRREIERMPSHYRDVLVAHYLDELDLREASERLGVTESAVKARLWRARDRMRAALVAAERNAA